MAHTTGPAQAETAAASSSAPPAAPTPPAPTGEPAARPVLAHVPAQAAAEVERLAHALADRFRTVPPDQRLIVAIAGAPGSGKSTIAYPLTDRLNELLAPAPSSDAAAADLADSPAICVGLDGWHYSRAELDRFADPADAHWRRGAPDTFDLAAYLGFLRALRAPLLPDPPAPIAFPTFDHKLKDPRPSPVPVRARHRAVVVEGLYTHLDAPGWRDAAALPDVRVWVEVERAVARRRVVRRNFEAGIVDSLEATERRVDAVDMENLDVVVGQRVKPDYVISPIDDPEYEQYVDPRISGVI